MKRILYPVISLVIMLSACSGSETYRGEWKATNKKGQELNLTFYEKKFSIYMSNEDSSIFTYSQNSVKIENGVKTYGIKLDDGRKYIINFPISNDDTKGIIADSNDNIHYIISRNSYLRYDDIYNLE